MIHGEHHMTSEEDIMESFSSPNKGKVIIEE